MVLKEYKTWKKKQAKQQIYADSLLTQSKNLADQKVV